MPKLGQTVVKQSCVLGLRHHRYFGKCNWARNRPLAGRENKSLSALYLTPLTEVSNAYHRKRNLKTCRGPPPPPHVTGSGGALGGVTTACAGTRDHTHTHTHTHTPHTHTTHTHTHPPHTHTPPPHTHTHTRRPALLPVT